MYTFPEKIRSNLDLSFFFFYIRFSHQACADTGIPFDTCYTTKALMGLVEELRKDSSQFQARSNFYWIKIKDFFNLMPFKTLKFGVLIVP